MSAAVRTLIEGWMIPRMDARIIHVGAFTGNRGSVRVFEKNGFVSEDPVDYPLINNSGIKHQGLHVLTWKRQAKT